MPARTGRLPGGQQNTWYLETPAGMLEKLRWEIQGLAAADGGSYAAMYFACNGASTAWHIADWVWTTTPEDRRDALCKALGAEVRFGSLQDAVKHRCRDLALCQQIANAWKHSQIKEHHDPGVSTAIAMTEANGHELLFVDAERANSDGFPHMQPALVTLRAAVDAWMEILPLGGIDIKGKR